MKIACLIIACLYFHIITLGAPPHEITSPNKKISVTIDNNKAITYTISYEGKQLLSPSPIALEIAPMRGYRADDYTIQKVSTRTVQETIISPVPEKRRIIPDYYNEITIRFKQPISLIVRVYDDGVAYRFATHWKDSITINNEKATFNFPETPYMYYPEVVKRDNVDSFHTSFEEPYKYKPIDSLTGNNLCFTPVLVSPWRGPRVLITESDLLDYPGMYITGSGGNTLQAKFAPYPLEEKILEGEFPAAIVTKRAPYIAKTKGSRTYPWRVLIIAANDKELPENDLVYRLATPSKVKDVSWINPGKGTDEWIIGINLFNVPFKTGVNTATYKYYIDFAKHFGFNRIMMDAGWSDYKDLFKINPNIDMNEIAAYAKQQNIKLSMWTLSVTLDKQLEPALEQFNKWGVDFIMTDFMDRDDQPMVNFYERIAEACARHRIMIMFHGAYKPAGFNRTWPNAITREGVLGSEYNIWSEKATPKHDLLLPFIRMVSGPMDYEPGVMDNATAKTFRPIADKVMSLGTRCHQGAMFIVYESPIQLFSGNPSQGWMEPAYMELIGSIPTVWDTTMVLSASVGDHIITARKKDNDWFIGAMTEWAPNVFTIPLNFLEEGKYEVTICEDGINADRYPSDYHLYTIEKSNKDSLSINMASGGGYISRLRKL